MLISFLEYNCTSQEAKKVSDYGAPFKVIKYIDTKKDDIKRSFDLYERKSYELLKESFDLD